MVIYTYSYKWGTKGSSNGQFQDPHDISFDSASPTANLFVCDRVRNDVQKFTHTGTYISKFGSGGSSNGQFNVPYAIQHTRDYANIYVCDRDNNRVQKFSSSGVYISKITTVNGQALNGPEDITFASNGDMYICDTGNNRIVQLDSTHTFIRQWGTFGTADGQFDHPHSINVDNSDNVYISCGNLPYIQKFSPAGTFIMKWGTEGTGNGQTQMFLEHMDIDVFQRVHLINNNSRPIINVWDTSGVYITRYGSTTEGSANGQFREPEHVTVDSLGQPFVVDAGNQRIQVFSVSAGTTPPPPPTTAGTILASDLGMFLTGGLTNTNPNLSLGGNVSTTEVISDILNNVFRRITESEAGSGITIYRCVAIKNKSTVSTLKTPVFYMVYDTVSVDDLSLYSYAESLKNGIETPLPDEFTTPSGTKINFIATLSRSKGLNLEDLAPGEFTCVWLRVSVNPGAKQFNNKFRMRLEVSNPSGSGTGSGGGGGPAPPPDPDTGVNFKMAASSDTGTGSNPSGILSKMKARNVDMIVYNGDLSYSSSMSGWLTMTSSVRSKSMVSFGNHDVNDGDGSQSTINALFNAYGISKTYYSKIFHNVGIVVMEAGEDESVSSSSSSAQYTFVKNALQGFKNNPAIEWLMVFNHYPIEGPRSEHHPNEDAVRDDYVPLFDANGVDVIVTGHNHNLWRSKLLSYNASSPNNPTVLQAGPDYAYNRATPNHGHVYFDAGGGGNGHYGLGSIPSYIPFSNDSKYGYLLMEFSDSGKKITFKFYDSSDNLLDTSTLTHT